MYVRPEVAAGAGHAPEKLIRQHDRQAVGAGVLGHGHLRGQRHGVQHNRQGDQPGDRDVVHGDQVHTPRHPPGPADGCGVRGVLKAQTPVDLVADVEYVEDQPSQQRNGQQDYDENLPISVSAARPAARRRQVQRRGVRPVTDGPARLVVAWPIFVADRRQRLGSRCCHGLADCCNFSFTVLMRSFTSAVSFCFLANARYPIAPLKSSWSMAVLALARFSM